jgi:methylated-DNA-[protein]-cysteine S-methyltransferase
MSSMTDRKRGPCDGQGSTPLSQPRAAFAGSPGTTRALRASSCRQEALRRPNEFCCAGCPAQNPACPPRRWPKQSPAKRYFEGEETDFSGVRLDLGEQDPLFERIYAAARRVGWGRTTTYGALAKELGAGPETARDVGQAMANNPVALIIPCHRVLAAGNKVGGFSAPGGTVAKTHMLALEGVHLQPALSAQQSFGF